MSPVGSEASRTSERLARLVVAARYPVVAGWAVAAVLATVLLPGIHQAGGGDLAGLVPRTTRRSRPRSAR
jgi:hypothetical protein